MLINRPKPGRQILVLGGREFVFFRVGVAQFGSQGDAKIFREFRMHTKPACPLKNPEHVPVQRQIYFFEPVIFTFL